MKLQSSILLLSIIVLAASCSKSNYAQVEPDDLYFTHKDRKAAVGQTVVPTSPMITNVEPTQTPTEYDHTEYSNQHSPVLVSPSYGSPTIQQYGQQPQQAYYDTSVNPDYLYEDNYTELDTTSTVYYDEQYAYIAPPAYETPQVNNQYYNLPNSSYYPTSAWMGGVYYSSYRPYRNNSIYDPFGVYYPSSYASYGWYHDPYYIGWRDPYSAWGNPYCGYATGNYGGNNYGNNYTSNNYSNSDTYYSDGTKVVTKPRQSRSQVSSEVDKTNLPIQTRREDYVPRTSEAGRVATTTGGRTTGEGTTAQTNYTRRGNSSTYQSNNTVRTNYQNGTRRPATRTVQTKNANRTNGNKTVVVPTRTRTNYVNSNNSGQRNSNSRNYKANRSTVNRTSTPTRSSGKTRYSNSGNSTRSSSYGSRSSNGNRSSTGYSRSSSSGSRSSSYTPSRSSSGSSYKAPSRSSGSSSRSSYTPSRSSSSSSRSSGTRSSSTSSRKKN